MNIEEYKNILFNTIIDDYNNKIRTKLMKKLLDSDIASKKKDNTEAVYITSVSQKEKIEECLTKTNSTIKDIELLEIDKGYKYSIPYKINSINLDIVKNFALNIDTYNWDNLSDEDIARPVYIETDELCAIKFHKIIDCIDSDSGKKVYIRYPLLVVIHKEINILEYRFDRIVHKRDDDFYERTIDGIAVYLKKLNIDINPYEIGRALGEIVKNHQSEAEELICSMGFPGEKGMVVKYGENRTMPVLGELEEIINANEEHFTVKSKEILENFIFEKKVLSSKHYREIKWLNNPYKGKTKDINKQYLKTKIIFNYRGKRRDLIDFHYSNLNDMERMSNVIKFIDQVNRTL